MSDYSVIFKGTGVFIVLCISLCIMIPVLLVRKVNSNERKDFFSLVFLLVPLGTFCIWLLWVCMYMSQMNPLISPMRVMYRKAEHTVEKVAEEAQKSIELISVLFKAMCKMINLSKVVLILRGAESHFNSASVYIDKIIFLQMSEKVDQQPKEAKPIAEGEIRVTTLGRVSNYVTYAKKLLSNGIPVITIRGTGRAMSNVVETAEILRHMINGLHQVTTVDTQDRLADPKSKNAKDTKFSVCFLTISLSLDPSKIDTKSIGYQAPLTKESLDGVDVDQLLHSKRGPRNNSRTIIIYFTTWSTT
ncbi:uncharacterized protein TA18835 [Theileria annulata]|uniref:DNA/RNA-binding protein Alba-like domain-containing protein n=1 Tax=Theileria annulata TaxID=5874 RepID=Q4UBC1_THEAN|nr:uncharacterized protein TA18835 [Theileria annulata]CAI75880.1 hypothetical protein TA18835 [Theileria annulata]|eukprot:XP_955356.1 hypothetical protein TA18835 [Theileria annulata]